MINVTIGESKPQEKPFPKLMISNDGKSIVFFFNPNFGFPIKDGDNLFANATYEYNAAGLWNLHLFTDYNEPITIQNA